MILYDDSQVLAATGERRNGAFHADLTCLALLDRWNTDPVRAGRSVADALAQYATLVAHDALTMFFDRHAAYAGHVIAACLPAIDEAVIARTPAIVANTTWWRPAPPNWLIHFEAVDHAAMSMASRIRAALRRTGGDMSYVRAVRGDTTINSWHAQADSGSAVETPDPPVPDYFRPFFSSGADERAEKRKILALLARSTERLFSLAAALCVTNWAFNLRQYMIVANGTGLLIWAWCGARALERMTAGRADYPADGEWNCGDVPVLIAVAGSDETVRVAVRAWRATLPDGSSPALRLVMDKLFDRYDFEPV